MLWPYALKAFEEKMDELKVDDNRITPMKDFSGTTTDINVKSHHSWGCSVYFLVASFQGNIARLPKW